MYIEKARLLPNGDLLALYVAIGTSPWGMGLVRLDRDGEIVWKYLAQSHHDFDVGPDGRIYVLTHEIRDDVVPGHQHLQPPRIDDYAVVLSPDGEELQKVWLLGALANSPYATMLSTVPWYIAEGKGDYLHTNSIDVVTDEQAAQAPFAEAGQVLLSLREIGAIALLDLEREQVAWALRGPWLRQHDADLLADGRLLLFDNEGDITGRSRVLELDPDDAADRLELCRRRGASVLQPRALGPGAAAERQHADHRIRRRAPARGDAFGRDRVGVPEPGARRRGRGADPDRVLGPAHRPGARSSRAFASF